jgi:hypothetical protein
MVISLIGDPGHEAVAPVWAAGVLRAAAAPGFDVAG